MLVEDSPEDAELTTLWLTRHGYRVRRFGDPSSALEALHEGALPDVLVLDVLLPYAFGLDILETVRANPGTRDLPVIMVSSFSRRETVARAHALGASDYVLKPLREFDFIARVTLAANKAQ
jgi:CheY-like chemotaxis protein